MEAPDFISAESSRQDLEVLGDDRMKNELGGDCGNRHDAVLSRDDEGEEQPSLLSCKTPARLSGGG